MTINIQMVQSPVGELILGEYQNQLCLCDWLARKKRAQIDQRLQTKFRAEYREQGSAILELARSQLHDYFSGALREFDLPLLLVGTDFQKKVWQGLQQIPYGKTSNYGDLAERVATRSSVRAVATANGANAISIIIPCHRVIGKDGSLVGYAGGLDAKKALLALETDKT